MGPHNAVAIARHLLLLAGGHWHAVETTSIGLIHDLTRKHQTTLSCPHLGVSGIAILAQVALFVAAIVICSNHLPWVFAAHIVISFLVVVLILGSRMTGEYKLAWSIPVLLMPLIGGVFYLIYGREYFSRRELSTIIPQWEKSRTVLSQRPQNVLVDEETPAHQRLDHYLRSNAGYPSFRDTEVTYYSIGEDVRAAMLTELKQAKTLHFVPILHHLCRSHVG